MVCLDGNGPDSGELHLYLHSWKLLYAQAQPVHPLPYGHPLSDQPYPMDHCFLSALHCLSAEGQIYHLNKTKIVI
jgi:hypothetical protein